MAFPLYLVFTASWFLHLGTRIPVLGAIRFDLLLAGLLATLALARAEAVLAPSAVGRVLWVLIVYAVVAIPFAEWPGSAVFHGIPEFAKAVVFFFFTVAFVDTEPRLRRFVLVFVACQLFRVLEPLYLHLTEGYWGSYASTADWGTLDRLSGAPDDTVNPNGLAFIIVTVLPFLWYAFARAGKLAWVVSAALVAACLYTLMLTGSRSGFAALMMLLVALLWQSRHRVVVGALALAFVVVGFPLLSPDLQDRYLSTIGMGEKNEATAEGRVEGVKANFDVALRRPVFGHGLGTSREANANFGATDQPAHNLYAEVAQELGFIGLGIVIALLVAIVRAMLALRRQMQGADPRHPLVRLARALQAWLAVNLVFSLVSYGLSGYEWYLLSGLALVTQRLAAASGLLGATAEPPPRPAPKGGWRPPAMHGGTRESLR